MTVSVISGQLPAAKSRSRTESSQTRPVRPVMVADEMVAELDEELCWRALGSRDARFDGRFFTGVLTTGVYCRPICPARTPRRHNVRFFRCAAAAEEAGFRACLRCRPEAAPGTPAWSGRSAIVSRALRLITSGALDEGNLEALAARLGVGSRHLRRVFAEELGASPLSVAQTRRLHLARQLIDQTALPMKDIAFAAGFRSIRRFNDVMKRAFGRAPSELRGPRGKFLAPGEGWSIRLPFRQPFDWDGLLAFLSARAIPGVEVVRDGKYLRSARAGGAPVIVEARLEDGEVWLRVFGGKPAQLLELVTRTRRVFDLDADPAQILAILGRDRRLAAALRARPGLRVPGAWSGFELAVRAIAGQQVSVVRATAIAGAIVAAHGRPLPEALRLEGGPTHLFPEPEVLAGATLEGLGLIPVRATAVRTLAGHVARGAIDLEGGAPLDQTRLALAALPGFGPWTVEVVAMRALQDPDAFPAGDLGLRKALDDAPPARAVELSEAWRPWRSYAVMALWTHELPEARARRSTG